MIRSVKQTVTVQPGGRVEVVSPDLPEGAQAEVTVRVDSATPSTDGENGNRAAQARPIWEIASDLMSDLPEDEISKLPTDLAAEHDHYLSGSPKRYS